MMMDFTVREQFRIAHWSGAEADVIDHIDKPQSPQSYESPSILAFWSRENRVRNIPFHPKLKA
jgi:hypothetical protein